MPVNVGRALCLFAYVLYFFRPGHDLLQLFRMNLEIQVGQFLKQVGQIGVGIQAIGLTGLDDAV